MSSKNRPSEIVSAAGFMGTFWGKFDGEVRRQGGTTEDIYRLGTPQGDEAIRKMAQMTVQRPEPDTYLIRLNYRAVEGMMGRLCEEGEHNYLNPNLKDMKVTNGVKGLVEVRVKLIPLAKDTSTPDCRKLIEARSDVIFTPGPEYIAALGAQYPDLQREKRVIADMSPNSVWVDSDGRRDLPYLYGGSDFRGLSLYWEGIVWGADYYLIAVCK